MAGGSPKTKLPVAPSRILSSPPSLSSIVAGALSEHSGRTPHLDLATAAVVIKIRVMIKPLIKYENE